MKITVKIDKMAAIKVGSNEEGEIDLEIDVSVLTEPERDELSKQIGYGVLEVSGGVATVTAVRDWLQEKILDRRRTEAARAKQNAEKSASWERVLEEKKTYERCYCIENTSYIRLEPAWCGGEINSSFRARDDVQAWLSDLTEINRRAKSDAEREAEAVSAAEETKKAAEEAERVAWIGMYGSRRLKLTEMENIENGAIYRDERLALERSGWFLAGNYDGSYDDPRNPPENMLDMLAEARKTAPDAQLVYWTRDSDDDEDIEEFRGYCAIAKFFGREIVRGLPDDLRNEG